VFVLNFLLFHFCFSIFSLTAQTRYYTGAAAAGAGNASVCMSDEWAIFNNVGNLSAFNRSAAFVGFDNRFSVSGLNTLSAGFVSPLYFSENAGTVGLSVLRFGDNVFNEQIFGIGYSHKIQGVCLGLKINYLQTIIEGLSARGAVAAEFGGRAQLSKSLFFGMHIYNFNQAKMTANEETRLPAVMKAGLSFRPLEEKLYLNAEVEKEGDRAARVKFGIIYAVGKNITARTGVTTAPFRGSFGLGWRLKKFNFDYALNTHQYLPLSHHIGISFQFGENKKAEKKTIN
jgi:hypothetical protein